MENDSAPIKLIVIVGPTAVGKTHIALELASRIGGEIVSADSMQIYKGMDIGTAKPSAEERQRAVHHMIDFIEPDCDFSAAEYQKMAREKIAEIAGRGKNPIVAGGTGLYVNAILFDMDFSASPKNPQLRQGYMTEAEYSGSEALHRRLESLDPDAAERIHPNNVKKIIRALEILESGEPGGRRVVPFSESFKPFAGYIPRIIGLNRERGELYAKIDSRVDALISAGLVEEVRGLYERGVFGGVQPDGIAGAGNGVGSEWVADANSISAKGIGYKELIGYLRGEYDLEHAIYLIKRNSRRYAKRQLTWFRRYPDIRWFDLNGDGESEEALCEIVSYARG
ncbi:MAG: tRNA (adenosine(37)-N6)-dimethylallyltransferase MiaA [Clostridiales Family XIII bacterium]|jgi:tRNA dimethylallyltransferase|nr:tRNA (adenosine(37)-N6)-dimethylallyltransferase MiaA [Clostridiales Family XIII bacterium]